MQESTKGLLSIAAGIIMYRPLKLKMSASPELQTMDATVNAMGKLAGAFLVFFGVKNLGYSENVAAGVTFLGAGIYEYMNAQKLFGGTLVGELPSLPPPGHPSPSEDVKALQRQINALGWSPPLLIDGIYGPETDHAAAQLGLLAAA